MKKAVLSCFVFLSFLNVSGQDWYKQSLSAVASVEFPVKPVLGDTVGQNVYTYSTETEFYMVSVRDLSHMLAFSLRPEELDKFQSEVIRGSVDAYKGVLVSKEPFTINGLKGTDALITTKEIIGAPDLRYKRVIFINKVIYQLDFWTYADQEVKSKDVRERFFNSFTITGDSTTLKQHTMVENPSTVEPVKPAKNQGISTSMIVAIVIGIVTAVFAIWLKRKTRNKNQ